MVRDSDKDVGVHDHRTPVPPRIERAKPEQYAAIADLNVHAYREYANFLTTEAWRDGMRAKLTEVESLARRVTFLAARVDEEIAGSVAYCPAGKSDPAIFPSDWASLLLLAVSPRYRRHGIAKQLVAACIQLARDDGARTIGLFTNELMTTARRLYEAMGFRQDCEIPARYGLRYWRYKLDLTQRPT